MLISQAPGFCSQHSGWMYVAVVLGIVTLILLAVIIVISHQASRGKADSSESCSEIGTNCTGNCTSSRKYRYGESCSTTLKMLIENLCVKEQGCELCPPGWQLHMGRYEAEMEFLDQKKEQNRFFWIGLTFREKEGRWIWLSDPQTKGYRVAIHENEAGKHCALYKRKQGIEFESCQNSHRWICKKNAVLLAPPISPLTCLWPGGWGTLLGSGRGGFEPFSLRDVSASIILPGNWLPLQETASIGLSTCEHRSLGGILKTWKQSSLDDGSKAQKALPRENHTHDR
ncbi:hypothetical protein Y1Q_0000008 [Alligator mississippiensis]|uniref:C-type lectin domain-containing protein n=1 Tax=Alligator mississippiensis TaxID=8496 RepID=A0A151MWH3_ALLMI|nr:hypothetical protein Y1Q_0000008 [Alligator mississippiensis]